MSKKRLLAIVALSATLLATDAIADVTHTPWDAANRGVAAQRDAEDAAIHRWLEQFRTIKITLTKAVAIAEHIHEGSRTAEVRFEMAGPLAYRVRTVGNNRVWENAIDANTGDVIEKELSSSMRELKREDLGNITALKSVELELSDAVRIAENAAEGSALAGGLIKQDGKLNFLVVVASGDRLKEVMFEPPSVVRRGANRN